uniref:G-patch domain-containing protein n=1 Tax=Nicotiana tabacum TaxID=4097 RepID=A0A1S3ZUC9_TOBAC
MAVSGARKHHTPRSLCLERTSQHYYPHQDVAYAPQSYTVMNAQPYVRPQQQASRKQAPFSRNQPPYQNHYNPRPPQNNFHPREPPKRPNFTPIGEPYSSLLPKLVQIEAEGHDTDDCWTLKRAVENLIEQRKIVLRDEDIPNVTNNPLPVHNNGPVIGMICEDKEFDPALKAIIAILDVEKKPKAAPKQDKGEKKNKTTPPKSEKKVEIETGATPNKDVVLHVPRGRKEKQMTLSPPRRFELNKTTQMYVPKGAYVMWGPINPPRLSEPVVISCAPQKPMTDPTAMPWNYNKSVVTYKGKEISGEVQENNPAEKYFNLEEVNNATGKRFPSKKPMSAEEAEAFFQKMKMVDYEVIDQLQRFPAQVSLLSLLMNSTEHQKVLIKTLNEAYVPVETSVEQLGRMAERFFAINQISFSKNELPPEGATQKKALHLTVKCKRYYVKRVMLDGGSGVDICPLSTLQHMEISTERIRPNNVCVLDMDTFYNFLLGRPWIHAAGAIPSTLHQMVKLEHKDQEIVVHREDEQSIYQDPSVPYLEAREGSEHIVYQAFEFMVADQCEEEKPCPKPFLSNASIMVAKEMIRHGYKPGKGLGKSLQGIAKPITLTASEKFFGVGFLPTPTNPVPHLYRIFVKPKYNEEEEDKAFTAGEIEEICGAMRKILYEAHMVQTGEGSSTAEVLYMGPNAKLHNWKQKQRKFKTDISDQIKEEVTKQLKAGVIRVVRYTIWLANVVPVPKKDGKTRVCVEYRDLNK